MLPYYVLGTETFFPRNIQALDSSAAAQHFWHGEISQHRNRLKQLFPEIFFFSISELHVTEVVMVQNNFSLLHGHSAQIGRSLYELQDEGKHEGAQGYSCISDV